MTVLRDAIDVWHDRRIAAGDLWRDEIENALGRAGAAILLISTDFLNSKFISETEIPTIMKRHVAEGMLVFPLIVRPCSWRRVDWLERRNCRPLDGKPLAKKRKPEREEILSNFAEEIEAIISIRTGVSTEAIRSRENSASERVKTLLTSPYKYDLFVSYAASDAAFAFDLVKELSKSFRVFVDEDGCDVEEQDYSNVAKAQAVSQATIALLSPGTHHSIYQRREIEGARQLVRDSGTRHILIPVSIEDTEPSAYPYAIDKSSVILAPASAGLATSVAAISQAFFSQTSTNGYSDGTAQHPPVSNSSLWGIRFPYPEPLPSDLIGRRDVLRELMHILSSNVRVIVIDGLGGMGKTTLIATLFLQAKQQNIFEAGAWTTCQGGGSDFDTFLAAVATNTAAPIIGDFEETLRAQQTLRHLSLVSTLIVVDSVDRMSLAEKEKLVSFAEAIPPTSKIVIISRSRVDIKNASHRRIGPLDLESGIDLVEQRLRELDWRADSMPSRSEWIPLIQALEGSPWFIVSAVTHMDSTGTGLEHMATRLKSMEPRKDFAHVFGDTFEALSKDQKVVLSTLALSSPPLSREALSWISELEENRLATAIEKLYKAGLLDHGGNVLSPRYHMHQLTRYYVNAQQQSHLPQRAYLEDRYIEFYCRLAEKSGGHLDNWTEYKALDKEIDNLMQALALAVQRFERDRSILDHAIRFGMALSFYFELRGLWNKRIQCCASALDAALASGRNLEAGWMSLSLGWTYAKQGNIAAAQESAEHARKVLTESSDIRGLAYSTRLFGIIAFERRDYAAAIQLHEKAVDQIRSCGDHDLAIFLNSLAHVQRAFGQLDHSSKTLLEVLRIAESNKEPERIAGARRDLGRLCLLRNQITAAQEHLKIGLQAAREVGRTSSIADCLNGLALCCGVGEGSIARRYAAEARHLYNGLGVSTQRNFLEYSSES